MKTYGLATTKEDYAKLKKHFGNIQIRVEHGVDILYIQNNQGIYEYYTCNPKMVANHLN